ncbi:MAG: antibiotic biosynthesis monooxygenase [Pseudomonadota bacterium]
MSREATFAVIVEFETTPENRQQALDEIGAYVDDFLSRQDGFLQSWLHCAADGHTVVHHALWRSEAQFRAAGEKARGHPALPTVQRYHPSARFFEVSRTFGSG